MRFKVDVAEADGVGSRVQLRVLPVVPGMKALPRFLLCEVEEVVCQIRCMPDDCLERLVLSEMRADTKVHQQVRLVQPLAGFHPQMVQLALKDTVTAAIEAPGLPVCLRRITNHVLVVVRQLDEWLLHQRIRVDLDHPTAHALHLNGLVGHQLPLDALHSVQVASAIELSDPIFHTRKGDQPLHQVRRKLLPFLVQYIDFLGLKEQAGTDLVLDQIAVTAIGKNGKGSVHARTLSLPFLRSILKACSPASGWLPTASQE